MSSIKVDLEYTKDLARVHITLKFTGSDTWSLYRLVSLYPIMFMLRNVIRYTSTTTTSCVSFRMLFYVPQKQVFVHGVNHGQ